MDYEVLPGNTIDNQTLRAFLGRIERQYGKARRIWLMDRGIPTEEVLDETKRSDRPTAYLVGTPKGVLKLEANLATRPWQQAREGMEVVSPFRLHQLTEEPDQDPVLGQHGLVGLRQTPRNRDACLAGVAKSIDRALE